MKNIEQFSDNHLFEDLLLDESPLSINQHDSVSLRSIAISLKRIADALYYEEDGIGITTILTDLADK
jgi:hypothetical protein